MIGSVLDEPEPAEAMAPTPKRRDLLPVVVLSLLLVVQCAACMATWYAWTTLSGPSAAVGTEVPDALAAVGTPTPDLQATITALQEQLESGQQANPEVTPTPEVELEPIPGDRDGEGCEDKLYTYPANTAMVLYEFEVQSEVVQMNDFYLPGSKTIIVLEQAIASEERSAYAMGWGSAWGIYQDRPGCQNFDPVANAIKYAESRLDQGHAGLVVDLRDGTPTVVTMLENMSQERAQELWDMYRGAREDGEIPNVVFAEDVVLLKGLSAEDMSLLGVCVAEPGKAFGPSVEDRNKLVIGPFEYWVNAQVWWGKSERSPAWETYEAGMVNFLVPPGWVFVFDIEATDVKGAGRYDYGTCSYEQMVADLVWSGIPTYHLDDSVWVEGPISEPASDQPVTIVVPSP